MASWQGLQAALVTALKSDSILSGLVQGVWDHVPENIGLPCIVLGEVVCQPWRTCEMHGMQYRVDLRVISAATGRKLATQIVERMREVIWNAPLTVSGQSLVARQLERLDLLAETSDRYSEGTLRVNLFTEDLS